MLNGRGVRPSRLLWLALVAIAGGCGGDPTDGGLVLPAGSVGWGMDRADAQRTSLSLHRGPRTAHLAWTATDVSLARTALDGTHYFQTSTGLLATDPARGPIWHADMNVTRWAIGPDGTVIALQVVEDLGRGIGNLALVALDGRTGGVRWRWPWQGHADGELVVAPGGEVFFSDQRSFLIALDPGGNVLWRGEMAMQLLLEHGGDVIAYRGATLDSLDPRTGAARWSIDREGSCYGVTVGTDGTLYCTCGMAMCARSPVDGAIKWKAEVTGQDYPWGIALGPDGTLYAISSFDEWAISPEGRIVFERHDFLHGAIPVVDADGTQFIAGSLRDYNSPAPALMAVSATGKTLWTTEEAADAWYPIQPNLGGDGLLYRPYYVWQSPMQLQAYGP